MTAAEPASEELLQLMTERMAQELVLLPALVPGMHAAHLNELAATMAQEQLQIARQILPTVLRPGGKPMLVVELRGGHEAVVIAALKQLGSERDLRQALQHGLVLAFLLNPLARAVLRALGFSYGFAEGAMTPEAQPPPKIILPG